MTPLLKPVFLLFLISLVSSSCKQKFDGINGTYEVYYPNKKDVLQKSVEYKNKKKNGVYQEFYPNGQLKIEANYINNNLDGTRKMYFDDGQLKSEENYKNDIRNGWTKVYIKNGTLQSEVLYKNDECDGPFNTYYDNGKPFKLFNFKKGKKNGEIKKYYKNGQLQSISYYKDDCPGIGLKEYKENGEEINNDFQIITTEKNTLLLDGRYVYSFRFSTPQKEDELWEINLKEGKYLILEGQYTNLYKENNIFRKIFTPKPGEMILTTIQFAGVRKTELDNYYIKKQTVNVSISTNF
jgi:antitoxin component YwqK of YwqJK toxin-antitoxin module